MLKARVYHTSKGYWISMKVNNNTYLDKGNYMKTKYSAKRAFIKMCNKLGIDRDKYVFDEVIND